MIRKWQETLKFFCHKYTGQKLRTIGETFGIGDSAVSQICRRFGSKIEQDRQLKKKRRKLEKTIKNVNVQGEVFFLLTNPLMDDPFVFFCLFRWLCNHFYLNTSWKVERS
jgi:hypothetical protein